MDGGYLRVRGNHYGSGREFLLVLRRAECSTLNEQCSMKNETAFTLRIWNILNDFVNQV